MRPQGFGQGGSGLDDLGWNDMGFEPPRPTLAPVAAEPELAAPRVNPAAGLTPASPVHAAHEELAQRFGGDSVVEADDVADETAEPVPSDVPPLAEILAAPALAEAEPVPSVRTKLELKVEAPVPVPARVPSPPKVRRQPGSGSKAAFTLRLDAERHLKLRLACAVSGTSAQQLVTRALDALLGAMPEIDAMAERASEQGASKR
jgi:hypothetical protein